jgi:hypothetical protein
MYQACPNTNCQKKSMNVFERVYYPCLKVQYGPATNTTGNNYDDFNENIGNPADVAFCPKCGPLSPTVRPIMRYIINCIISDCSGSLWVNMFQQQGEVFIIL